MVSLKNRLAQATAKLLGRAARDRVVPFELLCDCGHRVAGIRQQSDQLVTCSACRSFLYVLPADVYPAVKGISKPASATQAASSSSGTVAPQAEAVRDLPNSALGEPRDAARSLASTQTESRRESTRRRNSSRDRSAAKDLKEAPAADLSMVAIRRVSLRDRLKRTFAPARLLAIGLIALLLGTGWWLIQQRQTEEARRTWRREMDRVAPALKERDITTLQSALNRAVEAARILGKTDPEAIEAESLLEQTDAVQNLTSQDLFSILSVANPADGTFDSTKASDAAAVLSGQTFVLESALRPSSALHPSIVKLSEATLGQPSWLELDCPVVVDSIPVQISVSSSTLQAYSRTHPGVAVLFLGTVETCRPPSAEFRKWQIILAADSCVLLTSELHAEQCGYEPMQTEGLTDRLERQKDFVRSQGVIRDSNRNEGEVAP